jgi:hypothetical protein
MRRKLNIPAVFLTALALGMWVGASWHSAAQPLSFAASGAACSTCCCSASKQSKKVQVSTAQSCDSDACAVCLAGALVYDAPVAVTLVASVFAAPADSTSPLESTHFSAPVHSHPPERGPPA